MSQIITQIDGRIIEINIRSYGLDLALLNTYSQPSTRSYEEKEAHYNSMSAIIYEQTKTHTVYVLGDMNTRVEGRLDHKKSAVLVSTCSNTLFQIRASRL